MSNFEDKSEETKLWYSKLSRAQQNEFLKKLATAPELFDITLVVRVLSESLEKAEEQAKRIILDIDAHQNEEIAITKIEKVTE